MSNFGITREVAKVVAIVVRITCFVPLSLTTRRGRLILGMAALQSLTRIRHGFWSPFGTHTRTGLILMSGTLIGERRSDMYK